MTYTMVVLLKFYPPWLELKREQRREYAQEIYQIVTSIKTRSVFAFLMQKLYPVRIIPTSAFVKQTV